MQVEILHRFESTLPADDADFYRSGAWRPQHTERRAWDLPVVGEVPTDLNGVYLRNTENPLHPAISTYHPFDGDGMVHSIAFAGGNVVYHNRFVRTAGLAAELEAGQALWAGLAESPTLSRRQDGWGARGRMKDASSTDVVVQGGEALTSFYQCGDLYRLDPVTLENHGPQTWGGMFPADGVSAHAKVDEHTGELLFFNYSTEAPYMRYGEVSEERELLRLIDITLPGPRLPHDMAFTENYAILNDCPLFWDPDALAAGAYAARFHPELPTRFAVVARDPSKGPVRWFEASPTFVLHWINAFEDGTEIVLDGFFENDPAPTLPEGATAQQALYRYLDLHALGSVAHRWRFDLETGTTTEERLSSRIMEFPAINGRHGGRPYRFSYNALPCEGWFGFRGFVKHDLVLGREEVVEFPEGVYNSELVMAPRDGAVDEDDGYLITFISDLNAERSECLVYDAADPTAGPLARIALPERMSCGTHACWAPASAVD